MIIKYFDQAILKSLKAKSSKEYSADFKVYVDGHYWNCYTVNISERDILCFCDEGTATFLVDTYGDRNTVELYDWEYDHEQA